MGPQEGPFMRERLVSRVCLAGLFCLPVFANETKPIPGASFRGGAAHPGAYSSAAVRRLAGVAWKFQTGGPVRSSAAVVGGVVYVGSSDGWLYAIDEASGGEIWRFATGGPVDSSPAVAGGVVFASSRDRSIYAIDARSGKKRWSVALGPDVSFDQGYEWFTSSPAVDGDLLFVGGGDGALVCLSADSGAVRWRFGTAGRIRSSPAVSGGVVYQGSMDGFFYALDESNGKLRWKYETEGVRNDSEKAGFDRRSIHSSASVADGVVTFGSRDAHQYALDAKTGRLLWKIAHPVASTKDHAELAWCEGSPAISGGVSYVGSSDGFFVNAVEIRTGHERWRTAMPSRIISSPAVTGDTLYAGCEDGHMFALDAASGRELWRFATGDGIYSSPVADAGTVFVGSDDGALYAFTSSGESARTAWRAVFWDEKSSGRYFRGGRAIRELLVGAGYVELDAESLPSFLSARAQDRAPSVVVFATDAMPSEAVDAPEGGTALVRQYLDAGGRIVWPGGPPLAIRCESRTGKVLGFDIGAMPRILGVAADTRNTSAEELASSATPEGIEWGMPKWWIGSLAVPSPEGLTVLGTDSKGRPSAWMKRFGERGSFVRVWGRERAMSDPALLRRVAEKGLV